MRVYSALRWTSRPIMTAPRITPMMTSTTAISTNVETALAGFAPGHPVSCVHALSPGSMSVCIAGRIHGVCCGAKVEAGCKSRVRAA